MRVCACEPEQALSHGVAQCSHSWALRLQGGSGPIRPVCQSPRRWRLGVHSVAAAMADIAVDWFLVGIAIVTPVVLTVINMLVYRYYAAEELKGNWLSYIFIVSPWGDGPSQRVRLHGGCFVVCCSWCGLLAASRRGPW